MSKCERCGASFMYDPAVHRCPGEWEALVGEIAPAQPDAWDEIAAGGVPSTQYPERGREA